MGGELPALTPGSRHQVVQHRGEDYSIERVGPSCDCGVVEYREHFELAVECRAGGRQHLRGGIEPGDVGETAYIPQVTEHVAGAASDVGNRRVGW